MLALCAAPGRERRRGGRGAVEARGLLGLDDRVEEAADLAEDLVEEREHGARRHAELRTELEAAGQVFSTETDTETVAQLVDLYLQQGMTPIEAAGTALRRLEGAYALAMIFAGHPELIIAAQHGAPLAVGFGEDEMFVGSDALALAPLTRRIAYLRDGDWTVVDRKGATFFDEAGTEIQREIKLTRLTGAAIGKGNFRHFMEKELHEHPAVIGDTLHRMVSPSSRAVRLPELAIDFTKVSRIT